MQCTSDKDVDLYGLLVNVCHLIHCVSVITSISQGSGTTLVI